jgi:hypothetical protein
MSLLRGRVNPDQAEVKEGVDVGTQQQTVTDALRS